MAYNTVFYVQSTKDTVPASASVSGTIATVGEKVIGTNTKFTSEFQIYDCLYVAAKSQYRIVVNIVSDTEMTLNEGFTTDVTAGGTPKIVKRFQTTKIAVENVGAGTATIDGQNLTASKSVVFEKQPYGSSRAISDFLNPILVDATSSNCNITIVK